MRLSIYFLTLVFLSSCTTIEVGREVVKVGVVVKDKVEENIIKKEPEIIEDKTIVEEQKIITEEKEEEKSIVEEQQKISELNFMGKQIAEIKQKLGQPNLARSDGSVHMIRYDSRREYFSYVHKKENVFSYVRTSSYIIYRDKETFLIFVLTI